MILGIDCGNSRIKWGVHDGRQWLAQGAVATADAAHLARLKAQWPQPRQVMMANVAGEAVAQAVVAALGHWGHGLQEVKSSAMAGGVRNHYQIPEQLGVDRWCALLGAWRLFPGPSVVVMAGTATTIDTLDGQGNFLGGLILPGVDTMRRSLVRDTAQLSLADGHFEEYPRCTADAIFSGVLAAQLGAIEAACRRLPTAANCLISGGWGAILSAHLGLRHQRVDNLPLEGLISLSGTAGQ